MSCYYKYHLRNTRIWSETKFNSRTARKSSGRLGRPTIDFVARIFGIVLQCLYHYKFSTVCGKY